MMIVRKSIYPISFLEHLTELFYLACRYETYHNTVYKQQIIISYQLLNSAYRYKNHRL